MTKIHSRSLFNIWQVCLILLFLSIYSPCHSFTTPDPIVKNFTNNGNGTITCNDTGLMWEVKGGPGSVNDATNTYTWAQAQIFIAQLNSLNYAGHNDWRLPTIYELGYIVNYSIPYPGPVVDVASFPNCRPNQYWSSNPYAKNSDMAWYYCFADALRKYSGKNDTFFVRAVREAD